MLLASGATVAWLGLDGVDGARHQALAPPRPRPVRLRAAGTLSFPQTPWSSPPRVRQDRQLSVERRRPPHGHIHGSSLVHCIRLIRRASPPVKLWARLHQMAVSGHPGIGQFLFGGTVQFPISQYFLRSSSGLCSSLNRSQILELSLTPGKADAERLNQSSIPRYRR